MGRIKSPILGYIVNHVGNTVFSVARKTNVMRSMPSHYTDLNSDNQKKFRNRFVVCQQFFKQWTSTLRFLWYPVKPGQTPSNARNSYNMKNAMNWTGTEWQMILEKTKYFRGDLGINMQPIVSNTGGTNIALFSWTPGLPNKAKANDNLVVICYGPEQSYINLLGAGATREVGSFSHTFSSVVQGKTIYFWGVWISADSRKCSDSFSFGFITFPTS